MPHHRQRTRRDLRHFQKQRRRARRIRTAANIARYNRPRAQRAPVVLLPVSRPAPRSRNYFEALAPLAAALLTPRRVSHAAALLALTAIATGCAPY